MKTRIKYMYENGNASLLEMLFSAKNMTDLLNKADFIEEASSSGRRSQETGGKPLQNRRSCKS